MSDCGSVADALVVQALQFATKAIPYLAGGAGKFAPVQYSGGILEPEKFICEVGLFLYSCHPMAARRIEVQEALLTAGAALAEHARSDMLLAKIILDSSLISELAMAHVCLTAIGIPDPIFESVLVDLAADEQAPREQAPWKDLESAWFSKIAPWASPPRYLQSSANKTVLAAGINPLVSSRSDLYGLTHALMYATDFGKQRLEFMLRPHEAILAEIESAIARLLDDDDFDLTAELLLAWPYLRVQPSPIAKFAFDVLAETTRKVGFLPSHTLSAASLADLDPSGRRLRIYAESYHTSLVMGLLAAAWPGNEALADTPSPALLPVAGSADALLGLLHPKNPTPLWMGRFSELNRYGRDTLAAMIADIALSRALLCAFDIDSARSILSLCLDRHVTSVSIDSTASLLRRFAVAAKRAPVSWRRT